MITVNGAARDYRHQSIDEILGTLGLNPARTGIAVAVNDRVVTRSEWAVLNIENGDRIEVVQAKTGG